MSVLCVTKANNIIMILPNGNIFFFSLQIIFSTAYDIMFLLFINSWQYTSFTFISLIAI
jgi:hypothetical protein